MVDWGTDDKQDLLTAQADGKLKLYTNVGSAAAPTFDGGVFVQVGPVGAKVDIDVGDRATVDVVDWNADGRRDLVMGAIDGRVRLFLNTGTDTAPDFTAQVFVQDGAGNLVVPSGRSSPVVRDLDGDGRKDLLCGNTNGELAFYANVGTDAAPAFAGHVLLQADGVVIDLPTPGRSRPSLCDWTGDGTLDVLVGLGDGKLHLYQGESAWSNLGLGLAGSHGVPHTTGTGSLAPGTPVGVTLAGALPGTTAWFVMGATRIDLPLKGGVLVPDPNPPGFFVPVPTDGTGGVVLSSTWPAGIPSGSSVFIHWWIVDGAAPKGLSASNAIEGSVP